MTDENLTELRKQVPYGEITPRWQADGGRLEKQSTVQAYEKAEKAYG
ncbi:hypothetical protein ACTMTF_26940 [Nonomuraea sp. ZG12]